MLDVANPDQSLRPGMTATADIMTEERNNVLLVPNAALRFKPNTGGDRDSTLVGSLTPRGPRSLRGPRSGRSEVHTSELQTLMRISYAVFCLKKKLQSHTTQSN